MNSRSRRKKFKYKCYSLEDVFTQQNNSPDYLLLLRTYEHISWLDDLDCREHCTCVMI